MSAAASSETKERVLSTLNKDGSRRWLYPRVSGGRFLRARRMVAILLIVLFTALPWIRVGGVQSVLLDIPKREFTFFGTTFLPTDTLPLMLFVAGVIVLVFLVTALFGRLWCGWGCPQTVYLEFIYRPIERFFDGSPDARRRGQAGATGVRSVLKYVAFLLVSLVLAHVFLAYFVPVEELFRWIGRSPFEHPTAFLVMASVTGLMMFDFAYFREQVCIVACPYGRLQSVLLDKKSLIISYDEERGEPRGRLARGDETRGDCVDCKLCVITCPTGIDIREGLQMECVGCAQCIDACDSVMDKVKRPRGLIRYSSQDAMETGQRRLFRPRVVLYPLLLAVIATLFVVSLAGRGAADVSLLRAGGAVYRTLDDGAIANDLKVKIVNRAEDTRAYRLDVSGLEGVTMVAPDPALTLAPRASNVVAVSIIAPPDVFELGRARVIVHVDDDVDLAKRMSYRIQGPFGSRSSRGEEGP